MWYNKSMEKDFEPLFGVMPDFKGKSEGVEMNKETSPAWVKYVALIVIISLGALGGLMLPWLILKLLGKIN